MSSVRADAQYNFGIATSDWSGTSQLYLNPAYIADSRESYTIDIASLNAGLYNNLGSLNSGGGRVISALSKGNSSSVFDYSNSNTFSLLAPYAQIHGPGCMVTINHKHSFALTTGISGMNQFNNFNSSLYKIIDDSASAPAGNINLTSQNFNYTAQVWAHIGLSYGGVVYEKGHHQIKVGATLRYLDGLGYIGLKGKNLDAHYVSGNDSVFVNKSDIEFASNVLSTQGAVFNGVSNNNFLSEFLGAKSGSGVGGDIGVVYEYIQDTTAGWYDHDGKTDIDRTKNRYKLRLSAAVRDIGYITYKSANNSNFEVTGNGYITGHGLSDSVTNYQNFRTYALEHGFTADTSHQNTKVHQPTALVLGADYNIYQRYYVNVTFVGNLVNRQQFGTSYYDQLTITPRFDSRDLSIGLPISYNSLAHNVMLGVGVRYRGFFIGSDDMLALFFKHQFGFNFYFGGCVPMYKILPKGSTVHYSAPPEPDMEHGGRADTLEIDNCPDVLDFSMAAPVINKTNIIVQKAPTDIDSFTDPKKNTDFYRQN